MDSLLFLLLKEMEVKISYIKKIYDPKVEQITFDKADDYEPIYSPDGQSIVFTSERDGNKEIYLFET